MRGCEPPSASSRRAAPPAPPCFQARGTSEISTTNRFGHGSRLEETFYYLAETIAAFDIVAVQEIREDPTAFERLMSMLGPTHGFIMTDVTEGPSGNRERLGFIFNRSKITLKGIAGEIVLPFEEQISDVTKQRQFARTAFACTFQSGWFKFNFSTVHISYGTDSLTSPEYARRVAEIEGVAKFIARRAKNDDVYNRILVGGFNIEDFEGKTFDALAKNGFEVFRNKTGSNAKQTKFYDQISFMPKLNQVSLANPEGGKAHGVFNVFSCVDEDFDQHDPAMIAIIKGRIARSRKELEAANAAKTKKALEKSIAADGKLAGSKEARQLYYDEWRTCQTSGHLPSFVELKVDFADSHLEQLRAEAEAEKPPAGRSRGARARAACKVVQSPVS